MKCFLVENHDPDFKNKINQPGAMWFCPWYYDPANPETSPKFSRLDQEGFLSIYYRREYSQHRPPLCVRCPDGSLWLIDQISSNGAGWQVSGTAPEITCTPSIVVTNYHGFLTNGVFSPDLEGRTYTE